MARKLLQPARRPPRQARRVDDLPIASPPIDRGWDAVVAWTNELNTRALQELGRNDPQAPRARTVRALVAAVGRVKAAAGSVEETLRAREIKDGIPSTIAAQADAPVADLVALPLWCAFELARLLHSVATAPAFDEEHAGAAKARAAQLVAGVSVRETAETEAFKRHHGIKDPGRVVREKTEAGAVVGDEELAAQEDLLAFCEYVTPGYRMAPHLRLIADALERVAAGECKRLMVFMPPRRGKSFTISQHFPAWYLGKFPERKIIATSCTAELAQDFGREVRNVVQQPEFERVFPESRIADDSQSAKRFHTNRKGVYYAVGMGGTITGRGAHVLIIDDPVKSPEDADSETIRRKHRAWYTAVSRTRLMPGGSVIVVMTRWRDDDLAGWLLDEKKHEGWEVISLPAIAEEDAAHELSDGTVWDRHAGDPLDPEWWREIMNADMAARRWTPTATPPGEDPMREYALKEYEETRRASGTRDWFALYQQRPVPAEGGRCQLAWFKRFKKTPGEVSRIVMSWDTGQKAAAENDPSVCTLWAETPLGFFLLLVWRKRLLYPHLRREAISLIEFYRPHAILIEDKGNGTTLIQDLSNPTAHDVPKGLPIIPINPEGDKVARWDRCSPLVEAGLVWLPDRDADPPPWLGDFEHELMTFPVGKHDDQVDSTSQFLNWARDRRSAAVGISSIVDLSPARLELARALQGPWTHGARARSGGRWVRLIS